ncbi:MAG: hypothetical protein AAF685_06305 [Cyanobacteria bacterium P01_C01_bin.89]
MGINALTFQSRFAVDLHNHFLDEFLSVMPFESTSYDVAISTHQISADNATQLGVESSTLSAMYGTQLEGIAAAPVGLSQTILAQQFEETDLGADVQSAWNNFVESGQIWALIIGVIFGYMFRTFTGG